MSNKTDYFNPGLIKQCLQKQTSVFELEHFDQNTYKLHLNDFLIELNNIFILVDIDIIQIRKPEYQTNSCVKDDPTIYIDINEFWFGETEVQLKEDQKSFLKNIISKNINIV